MIPYRWGLCRRAGAAAQVLFLVVGLSGCALLVPQTAQLRDARPANLPDRVELGDVPFFPQEDYQCGPAALATALGAYSKPVTPEDLVDQVYLPARHGSLQAEMLAAPRRYGMVPYRLAPRYDDLLREVAAGNPVIVLQDYGVAPFSIWHYAVVVGFDYPQGEVVLRSGKKKRLTMPFAVLEYTWKGSDYWAMVVTPPDRIPVTAAQAPYLSAVVAMERGGDTAAARAAYAAFLKRWPDNLTARIGLANAYYAQNDLRNAEAVLRDASSRHPDSVVVMNNLAQTLSDEGRNEEALTLIERAIAQGGDFSSTARQTRQVILRRIKGDG